MRHVPLFVVALAVPAVLKAGEAPRYAPAPDWVQVAPPITPAQLVDSAPALVIYDMQTRFENGVATSYVDSASRVVNAQALGEMGTVTIPWMPDRGDLTVHRAEIIRGAERVDLLAKGERFTILRREEMMEQRVLTGMLTASMSVEGLRVGDVLRVTFSISQADSALRGRVFGAAATPAAPARAGFGRARFLWPASDKIRWKGYAEGLTPIEKTVGGMRELTVTLPIAKQPDMPEDLPQRLQRPMLIEASSFVDWADVSRTLAPLYATQGLIAPGSALAKEVATIAASEQDPVKRTQRALDLVEDKVRYLALAMNGGGLTPQAPAKTWDVRYGDCKAKTLLLLAMLHELGIEAEPVLVSATTGGLVEARLPSAAAFDHVIVRATVGGETLWLDGTQLGDRIEDIRDTPAFRAGLPLRTTGADLMALPNKPVARPLRTVAVRYDQSAGIDMPMAFEANLTVRGGNAQMLDRFARQANQEEQRGFVKGLISSELGEAQFSKTAISYDTDTATATITAAGVTTTPWRRENHRYRLLVDRAVTKAPFAPDRTRAAWRALPVATEPLGSVVYRTTINLPQGVSNFVLEGDRTLPDRLGGRAVRRTVALNGAVLTLEDRIDTFGVEIPAGDLPAERARFAQAQAKALQVLAPATLPSRYDVIIAARRDGRFKAIEAAFAAAIAADPDETTGYFSRGTFRKAVADPTGAIADFTKVIELGDDLSARLRRGEAYESLGETKKAIADYEAARALDPSNDAALLALAEAKDIMGDQQGALALLDERIDLGDKDRDHAISGKAEILTLNDQVQPALTLLDALIEEKPGDPKLLNSRCWNKGLGNVALDTALKDCTKAIELSDEPAVVLDSRALIYVRMGRWEEALGDLDAALDVAPRQSGSLFLRGIVRAKLSRPGAKEDLASARLYDPQIDSRYRRIGITA